MKQAKQSSLLRYFLTGFGMGAADVVPGVSGGTIAFIFGIYEKLINAIHTISGEVVKDFAKGRIKEGWSKIPFSFLIPLFAGLFTAVLTMSKVLEHLLQTQPINIWSFFFGLVVASVFLISKSVKKWQPVHFVIAAVMTLVAFLIVGMVPVETAANPFMFFISGAIAICAMILPGISGSFLLIMLGKYKQILSAVNERDMMVLLLVMAGAVIGLAFFSRLLKWLFANHHDYVIAGLTGMMIGSLRKIWPWKETIETYVDSHGEIQPLIQANIMPRLDERILLPIVLAVAGMVLITVLSKYSPKEE